MSLKHIPTNCKIVLRILHSYLFFKLLSFLAHTRYKCKNQKCSTQLPRCKCQSHLWSAEISFLASSCLSSRAWLSHLSCAMLASPLDIIWNNLAFFWFLFLGRQIEPEMCTTCRIGAMSDSTVSLFFSGLAKNAILIQSCNPASNNSLESTMVLLSKAEKGTMEHIRSDASCLIAIVEQC